MSKKGESSNESSRGGGGGLYSEKRLLIDNFNPSWHSREIRPLCGQTPTSFPRGITGDWRCTRSYLSDHIALSLFGLLLESS